MVVLYPLVAPGTREGKYLSATSTQHLAGIRLRRIAQFEIRPTKE